MSVRFEVGLKENHDISPHKSLRPSPKQHPIARFLNR